jgi:hypothetical protein
VATYDHVANESKIYLNGTPDTTGAKATGTTVAGTDATKIGRGGTNDAYTWPGNIDEVAFYNVVLDSGAISDLYNSGQGAKANTVSSSALVCYLDMECDGPGSTNVLDLSGNDLSGTLNADAGLCIQPGIANTYSVLLDNPSYVMTKYLEAADSSVLDYDGASDFSYSVWVKWNSASATTRYIVSKVDSATRGFYIYAGSTGDLYARIGESNTTNFRYTALTSGNGLTNDVWTHIAVVWNNSLQEITLYATPSGGSTVSSTNSVSTNGTVADVSNSETAVIGRRSSITTGIYHWYGNIDEVSFWSKALSSAEVTEIWNGGTPTDLESHSATSDLTNWWRMGDDASDDLTGGTGQVTDVKGTSNLTPEGTSAGDKDADVPS